MTADSGEPEVEAVKSAKSTKSVKSSKSVKSTKSDKAKEKKDSKAETPKEEKSENKEEPKEAKDAAEVQSSKLPDQAKPDDSHKKLAFPVRRLACREVLEKLPDNRKLFLYSLQTAMWKVARVVMQQVSPESPKISYMLHLACSNYASEKVKPEGAVTADELNKFYTYLVRFWGNMGNYDLVTGRKFIPGLRPSSFEKVLWRHCTFLGAGDRARVLKLFSDVRPAMYNDSDAVKSVGFSPDVCGLPSLGLCSAGVTPEDVGLVRLFMSERQIEGPISRLIKSKGTLQVWVPFVDNPAEVVRPQRVVKADFHGRKIAVVKGDYHGLFHNVLEDGKLALAIRDTQAKSKFSEEEIATRVQKRKMATTWPELMELLFDVETKIADDSTKDHIKWMMAEIFPNSDLRPWDWYGIRDNLLSSLAVEFKSSEPEAKYNDQLQAHWQDYLKVLPWPEDKLPGDLVQKPTIKTCTALTLLPVVVAPAGWLSLGAPDEGSFESKAAGCRVIAVFPNLIKAQQGHVSSVRKGAEEEEIMSLTFVSDEDKELIEKHGITTATAIAYLEAFAASSVIWCKPKPPTLKLEEQLVEKKASDVEKKASEKVEKKASGKVENKAEKVEKKASDKVDKKASDKVVKKASDKVDKKASDGGFVVIPTASEKEKASEKKDETEGEKETGADEDKEEKQKVLAPKEKPLDIPLSPWVLEMQPSVLCKTFETFRIAASALYLALTSADGTKPGGQNALEAVGIEADSRADVSHCALLQAAHAGLSALGRCYWDSGALEDADNERENWSCLAIQEQVRFGLFSSLYEADKNLFKFKVDGERFLVSVDKSKIKSVAVPSLKGLILLLHDFRVSDDLVGFATMLTELTTLSNEELKGHLNALRTNTPAAPVYTQMHLEKNSAGKILVYEFEPSVEGVICSMQFHMGDWPMGRLENCRDSPSRADSQGPYRDHSRGASLGPREASMSRMQTMQSMKGPPMSAHPSMRGQFSMKGTKSMMQSSFKGKGKLKGPVCGKGKGNFGYESGYYGDFGKGQKGIDKGYDKGYAKGYAPKGLKGPGCFDGKGFAGKGFKSAFGGKNRARSQDAKSKYWDFVGGTDKAADKAAKERAQSVEPASKDKDKAKDKEKENKENIYFCPDWRPLVGMDRVRSQRAMSRAMSRTRGPAVGRAQTMGPGMRREFSRAPSVEPRAVGGQGRGYIGNMDRVRSRNPSMGRQPTSGFDPRVGSPSMDGRNAHSRRPSVNRYGRPIESTTSIGSMMSSRRNRADMAFGGMDPYGSQFGGCGFGAAPPPPPPPNMGMGMGGWASGLNMPFYTSEASDIGGNMIVPPGCGGTFSRTPSIQGNYEQQDRRGGRGRSRSREPGTMTTDTVGRVRSLSQNPTSTADLAAAGLSRVKVKDLTPDMTNVNLLVRCCKVTAKNPSSSNDPRAIVAEAEVGDETGVLKMRCTSQNAKTLSVGFAVFIEGANIVMTQGFMRVEVGPRGSVKTVPGLKYFMPNRRNNVSLSEWELIND